MAQLDSLGTALAVVGARMNKEGLMEADKDARPNGQIIVDFVRGARRPVTLEEIAQHLAGARRNPSNARLDATCYSVNMPSRVHYAAGRPARRTDSGNRYDQLFQQSDKTFVPYDPKVHGVWEIYEDSGGTKRIRQAEEGVSADGDADAETELENPSSSGSTFRLESHLRDYLAQNLHLFDFLGPLRLYGEGGEGVEFPTKAGPVDILAVGADDTLFVFELKVSRGVDAVVGQVLRYMGAVRRDIAAGRKVMGVIVAASLSDKLKFAVAEVQDRVLAVEYELQVSLKRHTGPLSA